MSNRLQTFDNMEPLFAIRLFAALYIIASHVVNFLPNCPNPFDPPPALRHFAEFGFSFVGCFFLLSGFVLSLGYLTRKDGFSKRKYFVSRISRLYPVYIASLLLDAPRAGYVLILRGHMPPLQLGGMLTSYLFLLQALWPRWLLINPATWFLSAEILYYAMLPFVGPRIWRCSAFAAVCLAIACWGIAIAFALLGHNGEGLAFYSPLMHVHEFVLGILLARLRFDYGHRLTRSVTAGMVAVCTVALVVAIHFLPYTRLRLLYQFGALAPLYGAIFLMLCGQRTWLTRMLSRPWLLVLGEASYGLYLYHGPILAWFHHSIHRTQWMIPVYFAVCLAVSLLSLKYIEIPARKRILNWWHTRSQESFAASSLT